MLILDGPKKILNRLVIAAQRSFAGALNALRFGARCARGTPKGVLPSTILQQWSYALFATARLGVVIQHMLEHRLHDDCVNRYMADLVCAKNIRTCNEIIYQTVIERFIELKAETIAVAPHHRGGGFE